MPDIVKDSLPKDETLIHKYTLSYFYIFNKYLFSVYLHFNITWHQDLATRKRDLAARNDDVATRKRDLAIRNDDVAVRKGDVAVRNDDVATRKGDVATRNDDVAVWKEDNSD